MRNDIFEKDRLVFLDQCRTLLKNKMYADVIILAEERLKTSRVDVDAYAMIGEAMAGMGFPEQLYDLLAEVEKKISGLSLVYLRIKTLYKELNKKQDDDDLIKTLSVWLDNIQGMRTRAAKDK